MAGLDPGPFVGRERELSQLIAAQADARALTLVGPGGVGKSRLALRLAETIAAGYQDGIHVLDATTSDALDIRRFDSLRVLVVLDNCESRGSECAEFASALLQQNKRARLLATSREPLNIETEVVWRVPPMRLPRPSEYNLSGLKRSDAVRLFVNRTRDHVRDFSLTRQNARAVGRICQRMVGLPLALEIVARHVQSQGIQRLASRLDAAYALRLEGDLDAPIRHHSLLQNLEWSYVLLNEPQRRLFARLAIFVGGWTLSAAEAVCAGGPVPRNQVATLLDGLVSRSLVVLDAAESPARFRFAPLAYQLARDQVRANDEESMLEQRLADFLVLATAIVDPVLVDKNHADRLEKEIGNIHAALRWAVHSGQADAALQLGIANYPRWYLYGRFRKGEAWLSRCLSIPAASAQRSRQATAASLAAHLALLAGRTRRARDLLGVAREAESTAGNALGFSFATSFLSLVEFWCGNLESADARFVEAFAAFQQVQDNGQLSQWLESALMNVGARIALELGNDSDADRLAGRAAVLAQGRGDRFWHARALHLQALVAAGVGLDDVAFSLLEAAVESQRRLGDSDGLIDSLCSRGTLQYHLSRTADALATFVEMASVAQLSGHQHGMAWALEGVAHSLPLTRTEDAFDLLAVARTLRQELESVPWPSHRQRSAHWLARALAVRRATEKAAPQDAGPDWDLARALRFISTLSSARSTSPNSLTPRERQVIQLLVGGLSQQQVTDMLGISPGTVRSHIDHMLLKLGLHSRAQLVAWALRKA